MQVVVVFTKTQLLPLQIHIFVALVNAIEPFVVELQVDGTEELSFNLINPFTSKVAFEFVMPIQTLPLFPIEKKLSEPVFS